MLLQWYVWMPIVAILSFLTWRNYQRADEFEPAESVLLILEIPKANDKKELAAEQLFASLHGILRDKKELRLSGGQQERNELQHSGHGFSETQVRQDDLHGK